MSYEERRREAKRTESRKLRVRPGGSLGRKLAATIATVSW